jgi:tetratricopeptide (TPR) repeat protein
MPVRICRRIAAMVVLVHLLPGSLFAAYVILPNNTRIEGSDIRAKSDGEVILTTPQGQRSFPKGQYLRAVADKPVDFDKAKQLVTAKSYDEAIKILNDIILKYRYLEWDNSARMVLGQVCTQKGDFTGAVDAYEQIVKASPDGKVDASIQWAYRQALLDAKQYDKLGNALDEIIVSGSRADAARAQIMRGDVKLSQNQLEGAVLDYLRTVVLYEQEKESRPEALYKAADTLKAMRDPRAAEMAKTLEQEFPGHPLVEKLRAGK